MNFINSWKKGNKKAKYEIAIRLGRITLLEVMFCLCCKTEDKCSSYKLRIMLLNFGFEM